jgi:pimeloyl-ACP methyl ester carboxylesterase
MTHRIDLSAGTIEYEDTGGDGPAVVLLGGLMMDASLWEHVIAALSPGHRCIAPTLPLGAHRDAMRADADLSPHGLARLVAELLDRLQLEDVTLVGKDTGGALVQLLACDGPPRVGRIVLVSCDAFENFPTRAARDPPRHRASAPRNRFTAGSPTGGGRGPAQLRASRPRRLGKCRPCHCPPSMGVASPSSFRMDTWSRYRTATR